VGAGRGGAGQGARGALPRRWQRRRRERGRRRGERRVRGGVGAWWAEVQEHASGQAAPPLGARYASSSTPCCLTTAALIDAHGHFRIERHVLREAPSLRVAHQATGKAEQAVKCPGHVVIVGNPLPVSPQFPSLPFAEDEVIAVEGILNLSEVQVQPENFFRSDRKPRATKGRVKKALPGKGWGHFALHGGMNTDSLVLAMLDSDDPDADTVSEAKKKFDADLAEFLHSNPEVLQEEDMKHQVFNSASKLRAALTSLKMEEVQGSEDKAGVQLGTGSTVLLSACPC
jgi:hypothetical protein